MEERKPFTRVLPPEKEVEVVERYIEGGVTMRQLAEEYGVCKSTISNIVARADVLDKLERKANARAQLALIKIKNASADAAEKLVELMEKERDDSLVYADIQLVGQVLDRAGVRETKEEKNDVTVTFAGNFPANIGMPPTEGTQDE